MVVPEHLAAASVLRRDMETNKTTIVWSETLIND